MFTFHFIFGPPCFNTSLDFKYPLFPLKPRFLPLIEQYLPNISDPVYSVHQSFMWFLWLNWRKSTFYPVTAPKDSKCWPSVTSSILEPTASNCDVTMTDCSGVVAMGAFLAQLMPLINCFTSHARSQLGWGTDYASDELCTCLVLNWSGVWQSDWQRAGIIICIFTNMGQPLPIAIVTSQWPIVPTGIYGRMILRSARVEGIAITLSCLVHDFITLHIVVEWFITAHWETKQFIHVLG